MMSYLRLQNYRGFLDYQLSNLARVNLLVGKNNAGKTSILEAVHLLISCGDYRVLSNIAQRRGEVVNKKTVRGDRYLREKEFVDVSGFFYGRELEPDPRFVLQSNDNLKLELAMSRRPLKPADHQTTQFDESEVRFGLFATGRCDKKPTGDYQTVLPVSSEGAVSVEEALRRGNTMPERNEGSPIQFITQDSLDRDMMSEMWDQVVTEGKEQDVVNAMRVLEPNLNSIAFLSGGRTYGSGQSGGILLGFEGAQRRHPLGSYGEGMRRLLALSLALARSHNGLLLIDEVDTGLHYSIMGDMWLLIVEAAKHHNIQVFLTTHSLDCVRGLAWLCSHYPDLGSEVSIQKVERDISASVSLNAEEIAIAAEQDIEVR